MKKILFLSFDYPYGRFNASDQCTTKVIYALSQLEKYDIHNVSYNGEKPSYKYIDGIHIDPLGIEKNLTEKHRWFKKVKYYIQGIFFPFNDLFYCLKIYRHCLHVVKKETFDLVVAQCYPMESVLAGILLKKHGYIKKLMVIYWDNIYGKNPSRLFPQNFALRRQKKAENYIAGYADMLVSLYPIKQFHDKFGDVRNAIKKREYLGIPLISPPIVNCKKSKYSSFIEKNKINILYSGNIIKKELVKYTIDLLNNISEAKSVNLIFFCKGVTDEYFEQLKQIFKGTIYYSGWIPVEELLALYSDIDFFISFPGAPTAICSKVFEYMSYGHPIIIFSESDFDVNITTFSIYPAFLPIDVRDDMSINIRKIDKFLLDYKDVKVKYDVVENLFKKDTSSAYVSLIERVLQDD